MIVTDASVVVHALLTEGSLGDQARAHLVEADHVLVPELLDLEVTNAARRLVERGRVEEGLGHTATLQLAEMELARYPHWPFLDRIWELRRVLTAYDALYVALAEALEVPLLTGDAALAGVPGTRCEVVVLG